MKILLGAIQIALLAGILQACAPAKDRDSALYGPGVSESLAEWRKQNYSDVEYRLTFRIPDAKPKPVYGTVEIGLNIKGDRLPVILDFREPDYIIGDAVLNGQKVPCRLENEHVVIPPGYAKKGKNILTLEFHAADQSLNRNDEYLYTLLVPDRARTLFPCFDQPDMKALYTLTLEIPEQWVVVSNTRIENGTEAVNGFRTVAFGQTEPLSTYLFSFVAGKFSHRRYDDGKHSFSAYYRETDPKKTAQIDEIFSQVASSLEWLEEYTGIPYPFAKYDLIILPGFQYGGMEHTGATLYNDGRMFLGEHPTLSEKLSRTELIAHETAHMWFGDLVTMEWFNDVWTKEVFANYFASRISEPLYPEVNHSLNRLRTFNASALGEDRTEGTVPIRQPLDNLNSAGLVYGQIIYNKAPVMMEKLVGLMGDSLFREGMRIYLKRYAYSNATWDDLVGILDSLSSEDLTEFSRVWVGSKGMPDLSFRAEGDMLTAVQTDPLGRNLQWPQRFSIKVSDNGSDWKDLEINMDSDTVRINAGMHPAYILPNTDGRGYGRFLLDETSAAWLCGHWSGISDATAKHSSLMNLYENYLCGRISPSDFYASIIGGLPSETNELTISTVAGYLSTVLRDMDTEERRECENEIWEMSLTHPLKSCRQRLLRLMYGSCLPGPLTDSLYSVWKNADHPLLNESDYISLSYQLALRMPEKYGEIYRIQRSRISNPDKLRQFDYIYPSASPVQEVRDSVFNSLMIKENRRVEPWASSALSLLNHPLREKESVKYIRPGLDVLEEVQRTGDIFFPRNWAGSLLSGHRSPEAWNEVRRFLDDNPNYPVLLKNKILQAAYSLSRANRTSEIQ